MNPPSIVPANVQYKTKRIGNSKLYVDPRISANQLALYMVSDPSKQESIVRDAKRVSEVRVQGYLEARASVYNSYREDGLSAHALKSEADRLENEAAPDEFTVKNNKLCAQSLRKLAELAPEIDCVGTQIRKPSRSFGTMMFEGVRISAQPDVVFAMPHRAETRFGGVIVNFTKGDTTSFERSAGKYKGGDYAAHLVYQMLALHFASQGGPNYKKCFAIDVYRDAIYQAPAAYATMLKQIGAACRAITRQWYDEDAVDGDESAEDLF